MEKWVLVCILAACVQPLLLYITGWGRKPARDTGFSVEPPLSSRPEHPWRAVGVAVVPGRLGKASISWPLGVMEGTDSWVEVRSRPRWLLRLFGARPMRVSPGQDVEVFPVRGRGMGFVGIRAGERECYFGCFGRNELLGRFQAFGYRVISTERRIVWL